MILHIADDLIIEFPITEPYTQADMDDCKEEFSEAHTLLDSCSIHHGISISKSKIEFIIYQQKITLDEFVMNNLFFNVIHRYFDFNLSYGGLGGEGCDFSLSIAKKS